MIRDSLSGTPLECEGLMKQCWDDDQLKRPDVCTLMKKLREIYLYCLNNSNEQTWSEINKNFEINKFSFETNYASSKLFTNKVYHFENFPESRNAIEEEQEGISKQ
ncbi:kinase-like domain-containing protein [Rhizophagus clarus]|nr:kinase-like domain-containing protein [Rhizophagus clarus]